jgi:hypothetical protein
MSGYSGKSFASFGSRIASAAFFAGCDPNRTGWLLPKFPYGRKLGLDLLEPRAHGVKQAFACLRRRDAARRAGQEPNAQPLFEFTDRVAQCRLRNTELCGGPRKTALSRYGHKGQEVVEISAVH